MAASALASSVCGGEKLFCTSLPLSGPFMDTSAVLKNLDLVIASDTAVAHLAGALGVPTWLALSSTPDWRWLIDRDDSPWYPTMRLFRQQQLGDWQAVFARMAEELKKLVSIKIQPDPILVEVAPGELIDKITILEIKSGRITEPAKLHNVRAELAALSAVRDRIVVGNAVVAEMAGKLKEVNTKLWEIEDAIRACERDRKFGKTAQRALVGRFGKTGERTERQC